MFKPLKQIAASLYLFPILIIANPAISAPSSVTALNCSNLSGAKSLPKDVYYTTISANFTCSSTNPTPCYFATDCFTYWTEASNIEKIIFYLEVAPGETKKNVPIFVAVVKGGLASIKCDNSASYVRDSASMTELLGTAFTKCTWISANYGSEE